MSLRLQTPINYTALLGVGQDKAACAGFVDPNGHDWLLMNDAQFAVNGLSVQNSATGNAVVISVGGDKADANGSLTIQPSGSGTLTLGSDSGTTALKGGSFSFDAATTINANFTVNGNTQLNGTLNVTQGSTLASTTITNLLTVSAGGITVTGNSTITGTLGGLTGLTVASGGLTVSAGGLTVTGNSTITGTLGGLAGLTVASGGATVSGGLTVSSGNLAVQAGQVIVGSNTATTTDQVQLNTAAGTERDVTYFTAGAVRWRVLVNGTAESGGNAGSDLVIANFADNGGFLSNALTMKRSTGGVQIGSPTGGDKGAGTVNASGYYVNGALSGVMSLIGDTTLGSAATNITFSSIPGGFAELLLVVLARGDGVTTNDGVSLQFNGDTGANYDRLRLLGANTGASAVGSAALNSGSIGLMPGASDAAGVFTALEVIIPSYAGTTAQKAVSSYGGYSDTTVGNSIIGVFSSNWRSTAAITSIKIFPGTSTNFVAGTRATLYGR